MKHNSAPGANRSPQKTTRTAAGAVFGTMVALSIVAAGVPASATTASPSPTPTAISSLTTTEPAPTPKATPTATTTPPAITTTGPVTTPSPATGTQRTATPTATATATAEPAAGLGRVNAYGTTSRFTSPITVKNYTVSSYFGPRCPVAIGSGSFHGAVDLAAKDGTALYALANGKVASVEKTGTPTLRISYGKIDGKELIVSYGHMYNPTKYVKVGDTVRKGQRIADVGNAGVSTGPHVHLAMWWGGVNMDPIPFFKSRGLDLVGNAASAVTNKKTSQCTVYVLSKTALKKSASFTAPTISILAKDTPLTLYPGPDGMLKVKTKNGTVGYVLNYRTAIVKAPAEPKIVTKNTAKGVSYKTLGQRHMFSYPGKNMNITGVLDTVPAGQIVTTTGKTSGVYAEMKWKNLTGWMPIEAMTKVTTKTKIAVYQVEKRGATNVNYFTTSSTEKNELAKAKKSWTYKGAPFRAYQTHNGICPEGTVPVFGFYDTKHKSYLYTRSTTETKKLRDTKNTWQYRGQVFCELDSKKTRTDQAVYRLYSAKHHTHFFTTDAKKMKTMKAQSAWKYDGIAWYSPTA